MPDSDNDSDFAEYGTSLEAIEEEDAAVRKKPISIQDQVAVDERGRRRFHGAFTGGFSAGYFNTVGSKEGWAPSTFKSSRADRNSFKSQNVLDFMDDEDKGAFGIAPQILRPTDEFTDRNEQRGRKRPLQRQNEGPIPGMPVLEQVLQPVKETVGIKILIKMGWRPGKGVGPKIQKGVKKPRLELPEDTSEAPETSGKMYGCSLPAGVRLGTGKEDDSDETDEEILDAEELLAPEDVSEIFCKPKENSFGLGYKGLDRNTLSSSASHADLFGGSKLKFRVENKNMSITGEAFGVGAFEDHDADIYSREDMSQYDFALETPDEKRRRKDKEKRDKQKSSKTKENCIEGFKLSSSAKLKWKTYPAPRLPSNFEPFHKAKKSRFELPKPVPVASNATTTAGGKEEAVAKGLGRHSLSISERQVLIESDINKVKPKDKDAVQDQSTTETIDDNTAPPQQQQPTQAEIDADIQHRIERLKKFTQVLQSYSSNKPEVTEKASFKPFMKNPEKQERYEKYLTLLNAGFSECLRDLQPPEMAEWERDREKLEFERASKLYKPMSSILSSRFTSAKSHDISHLEVEKEVVQEKDPKDDPKVAARMKLFGKLTHRVMEWHPDKLVCKRFNIPHPYPDSKFVGVKDPTIFESRSATQNAIQAASASQTVTAPPPAKKSLFDNLDFSKPPPGLLPPNSVQSSSFSGTPMECSEAPGTEPTPSVLAFQKELTTSAADEKNKETASSDIIVRAPLDLFKEIFADSTDESGDEEDTEIESYNLSTNPKIPNQRNSKSIPEQTTSDKHRTRDDAKSDKAATCHNDGKSLPMEAESVNHEDRKGSGAQERRIFDKINLDWFRSNQEHSSTKRKRNEESSDSVPRKSNDYAGDEEEEDVYGPLPPKSTSSSSNKDNNARENLQKPTFIPRNPSTAAKTSPVSSNIMNYNHQSKSSYDDERKKVKNTEEVIWVEKSALSDRTHVKSKKHSSSKKKSSKSHKSSRGHKHKKKASRKRKSKKHRRVNSDSESSSSDSKNKKSDDEDSSASSDSSVTINDSLDNKALLAKLKQITRH